jgi:hypothetical protein
MALQEPGAAQPLNSTPTNSKVAKTLLHARHAPPGLKGARKLLLFGWVINASIAEKASARYNNFFIL